MPLFATPSPAISKALARVTTRYGAVALCAHFSSVFRSSELSSSGAAGLLIPAGVLLGALTVKLFKGHTTSGPEATLVRMVDKFAWNRAATRGYNSSK